jgi:hypothetical protein
MKMANILFRWINFPTKRMKCLIPIYIKTLSVELVVTALLDVSEETVARVFASLR